jgi:7-cyano-7-deazaguanine synthase in queuosine biosynthesis
MKVEIKTNNPSLNLSKDGVAMTINLVSNSGGNAKLNIDFSKLVGFANKVSSVVVDFFIVSAYIYGADRFIKRRANSVDGWSREINISLPVVNVQNWETSKNELGGLLSFLTGDYWEVSFTQAFIDLPDMPIDDKFAVNFFQVNLFSGGLDSLIGAIDFLESKPSEKVLFVSHYDSQMGGPKLDQEKLIKKLKDKYKEQFAHIPSIKVSLEDSTLPRETTFRSRSILFIGMALVIAEFMNAPIIVPENGTVSLNYPISPSRRSSCSTRTTHPMLISAIERLCLKLGLNTSIHNPYEFQTKGEMVRSCKNQEFLVFLLDVANSCGKRGHRAHWKNNPTASHCGICMPCVYRQAALVGYSDSTQYGNDMNSLYPFKTRMGQDLGACLEFINTLHDQKTIKQELILNGLKDLDRLDQYISVVLRSKDELKKWIDQVGSNMVKRKAGI